MDENNLKKLFGAKPKPGPSNLTDVISSEYELIDLLESIKRLLNDKYLSLVEKGLEKDQANKTARLQLAEELDIDPRTLDQLLKPGRERSVQKNTFNKLKKELRFVRLMRMNEDIDLSNALMTNELDAIVVDYRPVDSSFQNKEEVISNVKDAAKFIINSFLEVQNVKGLLNEIDLRLNMQARTKIEMSKFNKQKLAIFAARIPSFNKPEGNNEAISAYYYMIIPYEEGFDLMNEYSFEVPWNKAYSKDEKIENL